LVKDAIPLVKNGGADAQVRINREFEDEDLDAAVTQGLNSVMIPKCEFAEDLVRLDRTVSELEKERDFPLGQIRFDLIIETARGINHLEEIASASPRIVSITTGQADLSVDLGFTRISALNFEQYFYAENRLLFAARAAKIQPHGLGAQQNVDFANVSTGQDKMLEACRYAFWMGYMGTSVVHPGWIKAANEGFSPPEKEVLTAQKVKAALDDAYARGEGSVSVDGRMYDVADMNHVLYLLARAEAIQKREAEKREAVAAAEKQHN
jgi:citrate lyase subunit beta/citryl-CoA lyase